MSAKKHPLAAHRHTPRSLLLASLCLFFGCAEKPRAPAEIASPPAVDPFVAHAVAPAGGPSFTWLGGRGRPAGNSPAEAAWRTLGALAREWGMGPQVMASASLRAMSDLGHGVLIARFEQRVEGIEVFQGGLSVALTQNLQPLAASGTLSRVVRPKSRDFGMDGRGAVVVALRELTGAQAGEGEVHETGLLPGGDVAYALPDLRVAGGRLIASARARRVWFAQPGGLAPARYVEVDMSHAGSTDGELHAVVVGERGEVLFRNNLTATDAYTYRVWADRDGRLAPWDSPHGTDFTPHPTGLRDGSQPTLKESSLVTLRNLPFSRNDPWLGSDATELRGNNVWAYADLAAPSGFGPGDLAVTPSAPGRFDRLYDLSTPPKGSMDSTQAITTHLFYVLNYLHDLYYDAGWDEKSGNPQQENFDRGGLGADSIRAEAQDYGGRNNANASTPADGMSPRIQMYLWSTPLGRQLTVESPADLKGEYRAVAASFGPQKFDLTLGLVVVDDGMMTRADGCETPFVNAEKVAGKIALIERGTCPFVQKVQNAEKNGAKGVLIVNNVPGLPPDPLGGTATMPINIPTMGISQEDGQKIGVKLVSEATPVEVRFLSNPLDRDGSLDTTIVAHEWAHILSNRLVGNANGLSNLQGRGMGEGWSDFVALLTIARPEDRTALGGKGLEGTYAVGAHALSRQHSFYEGIRRYPFSFDMRRNPLTFKHIQAGVPLPANPPPSFGQDGTNNHEVHNTGEVWASMLWDCYVSLQKDGGYDFETAQKKMREYLVAGLKLTPRAPTILEARDAILAAAYAGSPRDHALFWKAFARRGAGTGAKGPDRRSPNNTPVVESFAVENDLVFEGAELDDAERTCDGDGVLDDREVGTLRIKIRNTGAGALEGARVRLSADRAGVVFPDGPSARFQRVEPYDTASVKVKVALYDATPLLPVNLRMVFTDPGIQSGREITGSLSVIANYDDVAMSSKTDSVDGPTSPFSTGGDGMLDTTKPWRRVFEGINGRWHIDGNEAPSDQYLVSPPLEISGERVEIRFKHRYLFETFRGQFMDGGVVEISLDGGMTWQDVGEHITEGKYNATIYADNLVLKGRKAFSGSSTGYPKYIETVIDLPPAGARTMLLRFRAGTDEGTGSAGWDVDDIMISGIQNQPFPGRVPHRAMCQNRRPVAEAGPDQTAAPGSIVVIKGSGADEDGDALTFSWTQVSGPMALGMHAPGAELVFVAPDVSEKTLLTLSLVVNDGWIDSAPDTVTITLDPALRRESVDTGGCGCRVPGSGDAPSGLASLVTLLGLAGLIGRRRRAP